MPKGNQGAIHKSPPQGLQHLIKKSGYKRHTPTPPGLRVSVPDSSNTPPQSRHTPPSGYAPLGLGHATRYATQPRTRGITY